ncbi:MAG: nucleoside-diphosphate sugar epimerase/dehydratase [Odoribacter sp.]|uniref:polysaccharide biosynthesis protein n=1 Tax=Bacteroides acidifaciens TaxID=85831 RepID=UPI0025A5A039|nr:nucleoside-diphosphate sugar epimerase/dehydratase [Bacteroides acidifaciens]MCX4291359.1 nucleoside-diphosphate sugar epimerase/dehydratase [Odoribacter sp.]
MVAFVSHGINRMRVLQKISYTPRWIIFAIDVCLSLFSIAIACLVLTNFQLDKIVWNSLVKIMMVVMGVRVISFILGRTYSGIIRYTGTEDVLRIFYVLTAGELVLLLFNAGFFIFDQTFFIPLGFLLIEYMVLMCIMTVSRLFVKITFAQYLDAEKVKKNVIICGSDEYGMMAKHALDNAVDASYNILAFVDMNDKKAGKVLEGVKIYKSQALAYLLKRYNVDKVVIAKKLLAQDKKRKLIETCLKYNVNVLEVPQFESWINGELNIRHIKNIKIEDLLDRGVIELDDNALRKQLLNKTILVTGAAGSIGSEIVRQLTRFKPARIILFDEAESPLYDIQLELSEKFRFNDYVIEMGDVREYQRVEKVFLKYKPDIVYHAAAYKHVPMVELLPLEGIKTNVFGTKNVADLAVKYGVDKFVMISTDKAVNPTNVMGCTKRIAEIYIQSLNSKSETSFITTRFGNVLGSNGSVIPRFTKQIEAGGPVTVTHPDITRFFMTIPEACQLVLQAGALGEGGEIFVFDMGESVKIVDLARKMIKLSGFEVGKDIHIVFTGLRPGEKLYEEVLNVKETTLPTPHKRIKRAKVREYDFEEIKCEMQELSEIMKEGNTFEVVRKMKLIVPEFKSKNSVYEEIDFQLEAVKMEYIMEKAVRE